MIWFNFIYIQFSRKSFMFIIIKCNFIKREKKNLVLFTVNILDYLILKLVIDFSLFFCLHITLLKWNDVLFEWKYFKICSPYGVKIKLSQNKIKIICFVTYGLCLVSRKFEGKCKENKIEKKKGKNLSQASILNNQVC